MILTTRFLKQKIRRLAKGAAARTHCYRSLDDVKYVLFVCEACDWNEVSRCVNTLKAKGKKVHVCVYIRKQDPSPIWDYAYLVIEADRDINLWGFPNRNIRDQLNDMKVDMLIDLTRPDTLAMRYLMLSHVSDFKVGAKRDSDDDLYDLSILVSDETHNVSFIFEQILIYLQAIRSK
jgi:hypothetical protein